MFIRCLNPDCGLPFDHRKGRLIRFCRPAFENGLPTNQKIVEHYWLCEKCSKRYVFDYGRENGMGIKPRAAEVSPQAEIGFVAVS